MIAREVAALAGGWARLKNEPLEMALRAVFKNESLRGKGELRALFYAERARLRQMLVAEKKEAQFGLLDDDQFDRLDALSGAAKLKLISPKELEAECVGLLYELEKWEG